MDGFIHWTQRLAPRQLPQDREEEEGKSLHPAGAARESPQQSVPSHLGRVRPPEPGGGIWDPGSLWGTGLESQLCHGPLGPGFWAE